MGLYAFFLALWCSNMANISNKEEFVILQQDISDLFTDIMHINSTTSDVSNPTSFLCLTSSQTNVAV